MNSTVCNIKQHICTASLVINVIIVLILAWCCFRWRLRDFSPQRPNHNASDGVQRLDEGLDSNDEGSQLAIGSRENQRPGNTGSSSSRNRTQSSRPQLQSPRLEPGQGTRSQGSRAIGDFRRPDNASILATNLSSSGASITDGVKPRGAQVKKARRTTTDTERNQLERINENDDDADTHEQNSSPLRHHSSVENRIQDQAQSSGSPNKAYVKFPTLGRPPRAQNSSNTSDGLGVDPQSWMDAGDESCLPVPSVGTSQGVTGSSRTPATDSHPPKSPPKKTGMPSKRLVKDV